MQEIGKYGKYGRKPLIMVKFGNSQNLSLQNTFQRSLRTTFKMASNEKVVNYNVVQNFKPNVIDILVVQNGHRMHFLRPDYCGGSCSFRTPKVGDGFDPNSFHSWVFRPNHDLGGSRRIDRGVQGRF